VDGLIGLLGGKEPFADKLEQLFKVEEGVKGEEASSDISGLIGAYAHGNEPGHHTTFLFNYAGRPWKTQELNRQIQTSMYTDKPDGLSGNEMRTNVGLVCTRPWVLSVPVTAIYSVTMCRHDEFSGKTYRKRRA